MRTIEKCGQVTENLCCTALFCIFVAGSGEAQASVPDAFVEGNLVVQRAEYLDDGLLVS